MITLALLLAAPVQTTWYVDQSAAGPGTGTQADPYARVDFAVSASTTVAGDTVLVLPGTYGDEAIDFAGKDLVLRSSGGPSVTTLSATAGPGALQSVIRLTSGESIAATVEGFTVIAGTGDRPPGLSSRGGGVHCHNASVTLRNVEITSTPSFSPALGGGIYLENGTMHIEGCDLHDLWSEGAGGAIAAFNATIHMDDSAVTSGHASFGLGLYATDCRLFFARTEFADHSASASAAGAMGLYHCYLELTDSLVQNNGPGVEGAGIYAQDGCQIVIRDSEFSGNDNGVDAYPGGALYLKTGSRATITDSRFVGNVGRYGGAIFGSVDVDGCYFANNRADGSGAYGSSGGAISGGGTVRRSVFRDNTAIDLMSSGGGALSGGFTVDQCSFIDNDGGASSGTVYSVISGSATITNSILRGGTAPRYAPTVIASYSNVQGGLPGAGNIDQPESLWPDLALLPDSPAIDAGDPASPLDPDGTRADMGAFPLDPFRCGMGCQGPLGTTSCVGNANSTGQGAELSALGDSTVAADLVVLNVTSSPAGSLGFFLGSRQPGNQPLGSGSQGLLCLGGNVLRFSNSVLNDRGTGVVSFHLPTTNFPQGNVVQAGDTWYMQYWFRDANPSATSNTSSALSLTFQ